MSRGEAVQFEYVCRVLIGASPSQQSTFAQAMKDKTSKLYLAMQRRGVHYKVLRWTCGDTWEQCQGVLVKDGGNGDARSAG